jgi:hypothetical protein
MEAVLCSQRATTDMGRHLESMNTVQFYKSYLAYFSIILQKWKLTYEINLLYVSVSMYACVYPQ